MLHPEVEKIRNLAFYIQKEWPRPGSDKEQWFRRVTEGPTAVRITGDNFPLNCRLISLKSSKPFEVNNIFFHTVDTSRLLPLHAAQFRVNWYAHKDTWEYIDSKEPVNGKSPRYHLQVNLLLSMMFELLVIRGMHDYGSGDVPFIMTSWPSHLLDLALDYWVEWSKGEVSPEEQHQKFHETNNKFCLRLKPTFSQVTRLVQSLLSDPAYEYVPRFIIFYGAPVLETKVRALFMDPTYVPAKELIESFPSSCGSLACKEESGCDGVFDFSSCRSLASGSRFIRRDNWPKAVVRCNQWLCSVEEPAGAVHKPLSRSQFQTCQRCNEVLYCSKACQTIDWMAHKRVCEARS
ncbi:hypothetical protein BYT27DRAFT_7078602 [Phlegmacium glaucopus]|nr:hypothetical protein BYT27DRAFT_7078602 [Phlegmacium glaucopus]